ncbi:hypothetical protein PVAND_011839 [Polypedilum vanderplanki]|uniref:Autophagy-related protein 9 n=1 Tax=Polypedilum vanderplanki TaxID=319348 RepID=A0A9J6CKM6_POLVA|nr:hypothetical protein PVAND_011839 [Polypedilum vanderplanki]
MSYQATRRAENPFQQHIQNPNDSENDDDDTSHNIKFTIPNKNDEKAQWNHITDLDSFFRRIYKYHQKSGFKVIALEEILGLIQFVLVVVFILFAWNCINYPVLFKEEPLVGKNATKYTINDVLFSPGQCKERFSFWTYTLIGVSAIFWIIRAITVFFHIVHNWDIRNFMKIALKIDDNELENFTWHEIQRRIRDAQSEIQLCVHKNNLTELDIYHRILRFQNYLIAMINKSVLPSKLNIPVFGEINVLSKLLIYNIELILFRGPFACFENNWHLKEEFKRATKRADLAAQLSKHIAWYALVNLLLSPLIFLWQVLFFFFSYAPIVKKEPTFLGMRTWSQYGRLYLRHFNELDHELEARLNRAYRPAVKYVSSFSSALLVVIAKFCIFTFGGLGMFLFTLAIIDEDVIQVEHVLLIITVFMAIAFGALSIIPDENQIWCPEQLMKNILCHAHYLKPEWRGYAHTTKVLREFEDFFQLKAFFLINEIFSPFLTFFVLMFCLRPRATEIVDFLRNFTVSVLGVGDVCSFAQMEIRKHGNPEWQVTNSNDDLSPTVETNQYYQGENGKTELSLVHFALTNPHWKMSTEAKQFLRGIRKHAKQDLNKTRNIAGNLGATAMGQSLMSVESLGEEYSSVVQSILQIQNLSTSQHMGMSMYQQPTYNQTQVPITPPNTAVTQQQSSSIAPTFDFERMLRDNLTDGSTMMTMRSQFLPNIDEDDDSDDQQNQENVPSQAVPSNRNAIGMHMSIRGSLSKKEGPIEVSKRGLLYSLCNIPQNEVAMFTPELTTADMCLSTLYLHELHHKQHLRRGARLEESQRFLWHPRPQSSSQSQEPTSLQLNNERIPLLSKRPT